MSEKLIPAGQLKPLSWFRYGQDPAIRVKLADTDNETWYSIRHLGRYGSYSISTLFLVEPLPDCTGFDWQPPHEKTALELAKELRQRYCGLNSRMLNEDLDQLLDAVEREAK